MGLKHGLLRKDISRKIIYLFLHRSLISRREDFFLIDRGISSIGRKFTERKIVRKGKESSTCSRDPVRFLTPAANIVRRESDEIHARCARMQSARVPSGVCVTSLNYRGPTL